MTGFGAASFGTSPFGGVFPPVITPSVADGAAPPDGATRAWPLLASFDGAAFYESVDPLELLAVYGAEAARYLYVLMSLFTDARAPDDAELPTDDEDRRGWWADAYDLVSTAFPGGYRPRGSLLWLLSRSKDAPGVAAQIQQYAKDSLAWMIQAGIASEVKVTAYRGGSGAVAVSVELIGTYSITLQNSDFWEAFNAYRG